MPLPSSPLPPPPIQVHGQTFELAADPEALRTAAGAIRAFGLRATAAQLTVRDAADRIESDGAWLGQTADNYHEHRRRLTGDLSSLGSQAGIAADTLDEIADLLTWYQAALDTERAALAGTPSTETPSPAATTASTKAWMSCPVTYHPTTEAESEAMSSALAHAGDLRRQLDADLALKESALWRTVHGQTRPGPGGTVGLAELASCGGLTPCAT